MIVSMPTRLDVQAQENQADVRFFATEIEFDTRFETFTVACAIEGWNEMDLYGFDIQISWDTTYLSYLNHNVTVPREDHVWQCTPSPYAGILHKPASESMNNVNPAAGTYWVAFTSLAPALSFNNSGTVFTMAFMVETVPFDWQIEYNEFLETFLHFESIDLSNSHAQQITSNGIDLAVRIKPQQTRANVRFYACRAGGHSDQQFNLSGWQVFRVACVVEGFDDMDLYGFDIKISWDTSLLHNVTHIPPVATVPSETYSFADCKPSIYRGILHEDALGQPPFCTRNELDEIAGTYWVVYSNRAGAPSFNGSGTVFTMGFGLEYQPFDWEIGYEELLTTPLHFEWVELSNSKAGAIPSNPIDRQIGIIPRPPEEKMWISTDPEELDFNTVVHEPPISFTATICVDLKMNSSAWQVRLLFNPEVLSVTDARFTAGDNSRFFSLVDCGNVTLGPIVDNVAGEVWCGEALFSEHGEDAWRGPGRGTLFDVDFLSIQTPTIDEPTLLESLLRITETHRNGETVVFNESGDLIHLATQDKLYRYAWQPTPQSRFIIVAGTAYEPADRSVIAKAAVIINTADRIFRIINQTAGVSGDRINYMSAWSNELWWPWDSQSLMHPPDLNGDGISDIDNSSSLANLEWAITKWAAKENPVGPDAPLYIFLVGDGCPAGQLIGETTWCRNTRPPAHFHMQGKWRVRGRELLKPKQLHEWLSILEETTHARYSRNPPIVAVLIAGFSGSFIPQLSNPGRVIVTSSDEMHTSWTTLDNNPRARWARWHHEYFSNPFLWALEEGQSITDAFNYAVGKMGWWRWAVQIPLLDDDGNGVGHTAQPHMGDLAVWLPWHGDGHLGREMFVTSSRWGYPWTCCVMPKLYCAWPPSSDVLLWARIENKTPLSSVEAFMIPPGWSCEDMCGLTNYLEACSNASLERFEMTDVDGDGNFTAVIPASIFADYASGPSEFEFIVIAYEQNVSVSVPEICRVEFTETGQPSPDNSTPQVFILNPTGRWGVQGVFTINGTAMDDVCLQRVELYMDGDFVAADYLPPSRSSYFEFVFDAGTMINGTHVIQVKAFDASGNNGTVTRTIRVGIPYHNVAIIDIMTPKTVIGVDHSQKVFVAVVNEGYFRESLNVTVYANGTSIAEQTLFLASGELTIIPLTWNTAGWDGGNYTIAAYINLLPNEICTEDNILTDGEVILTILGDVDVDFDVDIHDIVLLCGAYNTQRGDSLFIANCDIDGDRDVDIFDIVAACGHYGESW